MANAEEGHQLNRRRFLASAAAGLGAAWLGRGAYGASGSKRRPNVIIIYTDDQGTIDAACFGAKDLHTPNIDALAARSLRFTQFYAPSAICSASRAGLLTGLYPLHAGVPSNCGCAKGDAGMPGDDTTLAEVLKGAGYATAHIGKWHLGYTPETMPNAQGFDYSFGFMGGCIDNYSQFFYWDGPNRHDLWENGEEIYRNGQYFPDLMVEQAEKFMGAHKDDPFFLYFAINNPHYPYQGDPKWIQRYREEGVPYPRDLYAAFVSTMDEHIGRLMAKVEQLGLLDDTIVVFQSDNGYSTEVRAHKGGGSAGPYRGAKFSLFEGGIRVPALLSWPGHLPEGETRDQIAHGCDWMPTLLDLCGVPLPGVALDGKSLAPILKSASAASPNEVLHWQIGQGKKAQWAVRQGDWKLIGNPIDPTNRAPLGEKDKLFLSNLSMDITEMKNFAAEYPGDVARLRKLHEEWLKSIGAAAS